MRLCFISMICALAAASAGCAAQTADVRTITDLSPNWKFIRSDAAGAEQISFDDSKWQPVNLPHTWNNLDGEDGGDNYYRGPGWYRRTLNITPDLTGKSLFLKFDAASMVADVYVNGQHAANHKGAFAAFACDITPLVHPGDGNIIAVRVDNARNPDVPTLGGDFTIFGGLYRPVHLLALNPLSITPIDDAGPGIYATQTSVTPDAASLHLVAEVRNGDTIPHSATVNFQILDAAGATVQSAANTIPVDPTSTKETFADVTIPSPHLWNGRKDPYLYTYRVTINNGPVITDQVDQPLGLRFFAVDPDKGFLLNGQPYALHGVNRHQDRLDMGWAIGPAQHLEDFNLIMEMGCTGIRLSHYQHDQYFYDLCDKGGLVVWAEACLVNTVTNSPAFDDAANQQVRELIKQSYNHPSICFWSLFNELGPSQTNNPTTIHEIELVKRLNDTAHALDSTRLTTAASNALLPNHPRNIITDVIAFNPYFGWYNGPPSRWPAELDNLHKARPGRAVGLSEYGAGASAWQHQANATQPSPVNLNPWHPEEWQTTVHEAAWRAIKDRPWLWGTFLWNMFDFASDARNEGDQPGRNDKGMITYDRKTKKDAFYFYKANWSDDPFVYITDRRFTPRNTASSPVKIYSNCDSVELFINGQSQGTRQGDDIHRFLWDSVSLAPGENKFHAIATRGGKTFTDDCTIVMDPNAPDRVTTPIADRVAK